MDENNRAHNASSSQPQTAQQQYVPYRRNVRHISQEPITDDGLARAANPQVPHPAAPQQAPLSQQAANARQSTISPHPMGTQQTSTAQAAQTQQPAWANAAGSTPGRKHMGVATSDPQYLQPSGGMRSNGPAHPRRKNPGDGEPQTLHYDRYLSTPSSHKTIFTARQDRARKRTRVLLALILIVVIAVIAWLLLFR